MKSVDIVFPVYYGNYKDIQKSVNTTTNFCQKKLKNYDWKIILSINGPFPEKVINLSKKLMKNNKNLKYLYTTTPGKGSGIKNAWENSNSDIFSYMDIDLAVDLSSFPQLLNELALSDIVVGSRYHKKSIVKRSIVRRATSFIYHKLFQNFFLGVSYDDAHCGFKSIKKEVAKKILPYVQDSGWFFDSEIMYLLDKLGYKIKTIPVIWNDSGQSGLNLKKVIPGFFLKVIELKLRDLPYYLRKK